MFSMFLHFPPQWGGWHTGYKSFLLSAELFDLDAFSMWDQIYVRCMGLEDVPPPRFALLVKLNHVHLPYARPYMLNGQRAFVGTVCKNNARVRKARPGAHT